jgi:hypothetical protein
MRYFSTAPRRLLSLSLLPAEIAPPFSPPRVARAIDAGEGEHEEGAGVRRCGRVGIDVSYAAPQAHEIINVALHREYSPGIVFIFF